MLRNQATRSGHHLNRQGVITCCAGKSFKDENRLALFALEQQALVGSCKEPKPWGWNVVESAKWQAWSQLQDMAPVEAMRLYVRLLEVELVNPKCCLQSLRIGNS